MRGDTSRQILKHLSKLYDCGVTVALSDEELLEQFLSGSDESAESGFSALVKRHGPMVLGVCRRVLGDRHAAEDAFQATFLVLAQGSGTLASGTVGKLASWRGLACCRGCPRLRCASARQRETARRDGSSRGYGRNPSDRASVYPG